MRINIQINKKEILIGVVVLLVIVGGIFLLLNKDKLKIGLSGGEEGGETDVTEDTVGMAVSDFTTELDGISDQFAEIDRVLGS